MGQGTAAVCLLASRAVAGGALPNGGCLLRSFPFSRRTEVGVMSHRKVRRAPGAEAAGGGRQHAELQTLRRLFCYPRSSVQRLAVPWALAGVHHAAHSHAALVQPRQAGVTSMGRLNCAQHPRRGG